MVGAKNSHGKTKSTLNEVSGPPFFPFPSQVWSGLTLRVYEAVIKL